VTADVGRTAPPPDEIGEEARTHTQLMERICDPLREEYPEVGLETRQVGGGTAAALVEASREAALLVISRRQPAAHFGLRLGTAVHAVLHHAACPVAVVPI
jgi:nucleotide-binding universal stress UspA family protein